MESSWAAAGLASRSVTSASPSHPHHDRETIPASRVAEQHMSIRVQLRVQHLAPLPLLPSRSSTWQFYLKEFVLSHKEICQDLCAET